MKNKWNKENQTNTKTKLKAKIETITKRKVK